MTPQQSLRKALTGPQLTGTLRTTVAGSLAASRVAKVLRRDGVVHGSSATKEKPDGEGLQIP
jgi:hypothetical protein